MTVGDRIKAAREDRDMTQEELGKICGVKKQTIFKYENNIITNIPFDKLKLISKGLKVSIPKLMDWETEDGGIDFGIAQNETGLSEEEVENLISVGSPQNQVKCISVGLSSKEKKHIKKYRSLDPYGQEAVDGVLDVEHRRCEEDRKEREAKAKILHDEKTEMEVSEEIACFILPYYLHPSSAGTGEYSTGDEWEELTMTKRPPRGTSYVVRVHGESMEPTFHDGDKVFVRAGAEVMPGQIGIFIMDGEQYIKELGDGFLISHNPAYEPLRIKDDTRCQGLVLGVCDESYFE